MTKRRKSNTTYREMKKRRTKKKRSSGAVTKHWNPRNKRWVHMRGGKIIKQSKSK